MCFMYSGGYPETATRLTDQVVTPKNQLKRSSGFATAG